MTMPPTLFASFDPKGNLINCNERLVNNLGYSDKSEVIGKHLSELYVNEDSEKAADRYPKFMESGKMVNVERKLKKKNNSFTTVAVNAEMLYDVDGQELYSLCSMRDISDIKEVERMYREKNIAFEQLLEGTMAGHWDWMIQEGTEYLSPSFKAMFGYEDHEMENSPEAWQKIIHPDDLPGVYEVFNKHVESKGKIPYDNQVRYYHKDGSIVWVYCRGKVIEWDDEGNAVRTVGCHVDITPLKHIEEELYRSNRDLEQFAYVASHDLQEPLNTITDFVKLFEKEYKGQLDKDADQYLEFILNAAKRMRGLVKGVLSYSRIGRGTEITEVDCNQILKEVQQDLRKRIKDTEAVLHISELPVVNGYSTELHSLFLNLVSNSIKFRKKDCSPEIHIGAEELEHHFKFSIKDNGISIEAKNKDRIFDVFQRLNNMDSYEGTGIGLAYRKKIVQLHGGKILVDAVYGKRSTFYFTLKK